MGQLPYRLVDLRPAVGSLIANQSQCSQLPVTNRLLESLTFVRSEGILPLPKSVVNPGKGTDCI